MIYDLVDTQRSCFLRGYAAHMDGRDVYLSRLVRDSRNSQYSAVVIGSEGPMIKKVSGLKQLYLQITRDRKKSARKARRLKP